MILVFSLKNKQSLEIILKVLIWQKMVLSLKKNLERIKEAGINPVSLPTEGVDDLFDTALF